MWPLSTALEPAFLTWRHIAPIAHRARLVHVYGEWEEEVMANIDDALKVALGLGRYVPEVPR